MSSLPADVAEFQCVLRKIPDGFYQPLAVLMVAIQAGVLSDEHVQGAIASGKGPAEIVGALTVEQYLACCLERAERRQAEELSSLASVRS